MICSDCSEILLEYLYGLLDEEQAALLRGHLASCPSCQASLDYARQGQNLFARAARKYSEVAPFQLPAGELAPVALANLPARSTAALPRRAPAAADMRRKAPWLRWVSFAAAAALLAAVGIGYASYEAGLGQREKALGKVRQEVEQIEARFATLASDVAREDASLDERVKGQFLHLHVLGPATYYPGAASTYRVSTRTPDNKPATTRVKVRLIVRGLDQEVDLVLHEEDYVTDRTGDLRVVLPKLPLPAGATPLLVIEARYNTATEIVKRALVVEEPTYLTHLTVNKSALGGGDILFFRAVTLERFALTPIDRPLTLAFTLWRVQGKERFPVKELKGTTDAGGISGGEFAITGDLPGGDYLLEAREALADGYAGTSVKPVLHPLRIVRAQGAPGPQIVLDQTQYQAGQTINGTFRAQTESKAKAPATANQAVTAKVTTGAAPSVHMQQFSTDKSGNAYFYVPLPPSTPPGKVELELQLHDGVENAKVKQTIDVVRPSFHGEFYPEGGNLVAGVPNRVFFRLQVPLWAPAGWKCTIENETTKQCVAEVAIAHRAEGGQVALGSFTMVPAAGQVYRMRLATRRQHLDFLPLPRVVATGIALTAPVSVLRANESMVVQLATKQAADVLVLVSCRGRIVDQKQVKLISGQTKVALEPPPGADGVLRVTVLEKVGDGKKWRPVAERLMYRAPGEYLKLAALANKGMRRAYAPGEAVTLQCQACNEVDAPTPAWLHVLVIDARALQPANDAQPGLPAYFLLTSQVSQPEDLENADLLLTDAPGAEDVLALYLGTNGWRRFTDPEPVALWGTNSRRLREPLVAAGTQRSEVQRRFDRELQQKREALWADARRKLEALKLERSHAISAAERAADALTDYAEMPLRYGRPAVGVVLWVLLAAGALLLVRGLVAAVGGHRSPRAFLATALATLLCAVILYATTARLRTADDAESAANPLAWLQVKDWSLNVPQNELALASLQHDRQEGEKVTAQAFGWTGSGKRQQEQASKYIRDLGKNSGDMVAKAAESRYFLETAQDGADAAVNKKVQTTSVAQTERFAYALNQEATARGLSSNAAGQGGSKKDVAGAKGKVLSQPVQGPGSAYGAIVAAEKDKKAFDAMSSFDTALAREYAHTYDHGNKQDHQDTVLWYPALLAQDGTAKVTFELSSVETTYRVLIYGHTADGRLGVFHGTLKAQK